MLIMPENFGEKIGDLIGTPYFWPEIIFKGSIFSLLHPPFRPPPGFRQPEQGGDRHGQSDRFKNETWLDGDWATPRGHLWRRFRHGRTPTRIQVLHRGHHQNSQNRTQHHTKGKFPNRIFLLQNRSAFHDKKSIFELDFFETFLLLVENRCFNNLQKLEIKIATPGFFKSEYIFAPKSLGSQCKNFFLKKSRGFEILASWVFWRKNRIL